MGGTEIMTSSMSSDYLTIAFDGREPVRVTEMIREAEPVTYYSILAQRPDASWRFKDANGHKHRWVKNGDGWSVPTCTTRQEHVPCDGSCGNWDCEGYDITVYECASCGLIVEPRTLPDPGPHSIPGPVSLSVKVEGRSGNIPDVGGRCTFRLFEGGRETMRGTASAMDSRRADGWSRATFDLRPTRERADV